MTIGHEHKALDGLKCSKLRMIRTIEDPAHASRFYESLKVVDDINGSAF